MVCVLKHLLLMILRNLLLKNKQARKKSIFKLIIVTILQTITTTLIMAHIIPTTINTATIPHQEVLATIM